MHEPPAGSTRPSYVSTATWGILAPDACGTVIDWKPLAQWLERSIGYHLPENKFYLLDHKIRRLLTSHDATGLRQLLAGADRDPVLRHRLIDTVTINETSFFREPLSWRALADDYVPLVAGDSAHRPLDILIAACSRGQEVWSMAMFWAEQRQRLGERPVRIRAFDVDREVVSMAKAGIYSDHEVQRGLDEERRDRWMSRCPDGWRIADRLRIGVEISVGNLLDGPPSGGSYDLILCRNVLIYFRPETKIDVLHRLARHLHPGGGIVIGGCESIPEVAGRITRDRIGRMIVYR